MPEPAHNDRRRRRGLLSALLLGLAGLTAMLVYSLVGTSGAVAAPPGKQTNTQAGTQSISAKALTDHECDNSEWHFVINQINTAANAPATIHVTWANGDSQDVALWKVTGGVGHYTTTSNLDSTVTSATAEIYAGWSGQFNLSHGPCGTSSSTPPPSSTPPSSPYPPSLPSGSSSS